MPTSPGPLLSALDDLWADVRRDVPELPDVHITLAPTPLTSSHGPERWTWEGEGVAAGLVVNAELMTLGPDAVLTWVLHDAAHLLSWIRGDKDTTMRGAYHNQTFLTTAEETGLTWPADAERSPGRGFHNPRMSDEATARYAGHLKSLATAIPLVLPHLTTPETKTASRVHALTMVCGGCTPPRKMRMYPTIAGLGPVICGVCGTEFTAT